jgi:hypothetical protein
MPVIAYGQDAWLTDVLDAAAKRVADESGLPRDKAFLYAGEPDDLLANPPAEKFVTLWATDMPADLRAVAGGGAAYSAWDCTLRLDVFARLGTDQQLRDTRMMQDASHGYGALVKAVAKAVQVWGAEAADDTSILREPMRVPRITFNPRKPKTGWGWARVEVRASFRTDLS